MQFTELFFILNTLQLFFNHATCQDKEAVPIIIRKGSFELAHPQWIISSEHKHRYYFRYSIPSKPWNEIYHFCPSSNSLFSSSLQLVSVNDYLYPSFVCHEVPQPMVIRVLNVKEFRKNWSSNIEWYVSGYKFDAEAVATPLGISYKALNSGFQYYGFKENEAFVSGYSAFYDKNIKQMIAAQYELLFAEWYDPDPFNFSPAYYEQVQTPDLSKMDGFFKKIPVYAKVYKGEKPVDNESCDELRRVTLISTKHFIYGLRKRMTWFNINLISIWHKFINQHIKINEFLESVAQKIGKLKITSGISGLGSTDEEREQRTYTNIINNHKLVVSDFVWKVVEFKRKNDIHGIILVLANSLTEVKKKICEEDVCKKRKWSIQDRGEENIVYCCDMTANAIEKLEMPFLELENRKEFDLGPWGFVND